MRTLNDFNIKTKKPWEVEGVEWREVKLGEIGFLQYGYTQKAKFDKRGPKFLRITDIDLETSQIKWDKVPYCDIDEKNYAKYKLKEGDILIARIGGTTGKTCIIKNPPESVFASYLIRFCIADKENISPDFVYYFTKSRKYWDQITLDRIGKLKEGVNVTQLKNLKIPLPFRNGKPDLETQRKIVEYIEANFSRINKILEKKKKELEQLDELWESVLEQAFKPKEGEEWREIKFLDKINLVKGTKPKSSVKEEKEGTLPYLTTEYFREKIIKEYIPIEENKITLVNEGDLVIIADGSRSGELFFCDIKGVLVSTMAKFEFNESEINKKYLFWFLTTHFEHLNKSKYTATPHVNKNHLKNLKIPLPFRNNQPDLEKQKEIANYLDSVYEKIKTLKEKIQKQITLLEEMKESILDEVFNHGEAG